MSVFRLYYTSKNAMENKYMGGGISDQAKTHEAIRNISEAIRKPWYRKPEAWFSLIAAITGVIGLIIVWLGK